MFGLAARLIGGAFTPLIDKISASSARLLRKLALFLVAGLSMVVVMIALTVAFDLWIASMAGPIIGALAVAGLYFSVAIVAVLLALSPFRAKTKAAASPKRRGDKGDPRSGKGAQVDDFAAPLIRILQGLGLKREQLAVMAGASVAKQLGPVPLVGLAIVAGFLVGRMWDSWRALLSADALTTILSSGLFGRGDSDEEEENDRSA